MFLDHNCSAAPTVPVVLFLDDAHWMDPIALRLVRQLWTRATENRWKLLVVATHWEDEWKLHLNVEPPPESPQKLAQFVAQVAAGQSGVETIPVGGVANGSLRDWVAKVLPGLTEDQVQLLLDKARALSSAPGARGTDTGSPRVIEQFLQWLLQTPGKFFVARDARNPLLPSAIDEIRSQIHDLNDIVKRRYLGLADDVREALGWSSVQGVRFLHQISCAIARQLDFGPDPEPLTASIKRAEDPHCWLDIAGPQWGEPVFWDQAERTSIQFALARPEGWPIADVGLSRQITVADLLVQMREYELAERILASLHRQFEHATAGADRATRRSFALVLERLADVKFREGGKREAFELFVRSLQDDRQIVEEFGRSPEALRDVFVSLSRFALLALDAENGQLGCERLGECLELVAEIEQRGWATAQTGQDHKWVEDQLASRGCQTAT